MSAIIVCTIVSYCICCDLVTLKYSHALHCLLTVVELSKRAEETEVRMAFQRITVLFKFLVSWGSTKSSTPTIPGVANCLLRKLSRIRRLKPMRIPIKPRLHQATCCPATCCLLPATCCSKQRVAGYKQHVESNMLPGNMLPGVNAALRLSINDAFVVNKLCELVTLTFDLLNLKHM